MQLTDSVNCSLCVQTPRTESAARCIYSHVREVRLRGRGSRYYELGGLEARTRAEEDLLLTCETFLVAVTSWFLDATSCAGMSRATRSHSLTLNSQQERPRPRRAENGAAKTGVALKGGGGHRSHRSQGAPAMAECVKPEPGTREWTAVDWRKVLSEF